MPNIFHPAVYNFDHEKEIAMKQVIRWFLDLYHSGQLDLNPPYQRRSVWTLRDRKFFLDTIFRNYPSPAVFLHKGIDEALGKMIYHVVDGKQRLETIILFAQNAVAIDKEYGDIRLNGKKWKNIEGVPDLKMLFHGYTLPIEFIDTDNSIVINEVFDRLNRTSRKLERQELRHAKYDGWFIKTTEAEAEKEEWERLGVVTKARMRRMKDAQCISELLIVLLKNRIAGYDQDTLDDIYAEYDSPYETLPNFEEEDFKRNLEFTKDYILAMDSHDLVVAKYAKGFVNFYSLWAFVVLNQTHLESPEITAARYSEFMEKAAALSKERDINRFLGGDENNLYSLAYKYLINSGKANTDRKQREARNEVLESVLLKRTTREGQLVMQDRKNASSSPDAPALTRDDGGEYILKLIMRKTDDVKEKDAPAHEGGGKAPPD
jgi:hypothetical protein